MKSRLTNAGNTIVPAYLALIQRGFSVYREPSGLTDSGMIWIAEDTLTQFYAEDLVTLLGLVAIQETRGVDWQASDEDIETFFAKYGVL